MRSWFLASALLAIALALPVRAASPVASWEKGDWWEVQLEQMALHSASPSADWTPSFRLRFSVVERTDKEVRVEVTTQPQNRFKERLVLRYSPQGELLTARIMDPKRAQDLGAAGGFGVFGQLGREAFLMTKAPDAPRGGTTANARGKMQRPVRVTLDEAGRSAQTWRPGEAYWMQYETSAGAPQRAKLVDSSWKRSGSGDGGSR